LEDNAARNPHHRDDPCPVSGANGPDLSSTAHNSRHPPDGEAFLTYEKERGGYERVLRERARSRVSGFRSELKGVEDSEGNGPTSEPVPGPQAALEPEIVQSLGKSAPDSPACRRRKHRRMDNRRQRFGAVPGAGLRAPDRGHTYREPARLAPGPQRHTHSDVPDDG
jgi:hypothetical protein